MNMAASVRRAFAHESERAVRSLSTLPFVCRRRALKALFSPAARPLLGRPAPSLVETTASALSFSRADSERFLFRSLLHDALFQMEWLSLGRRSRSGLIRDTRHVDTDAHEDLMWLAAQPGALIGTMHFGPYSLGLVWLLHRYFQGRRVIVVKTDTDDDDERRAIARLGGLGASVEFVAPDRPEAFHQLVKAIRGGAVGIIMVDLPPRYGRSATLDVLGRRLAFASGTVDLAALCGAPLMLFRTRSHVTRDVIEVGDIFDVDRRPGGRDLAMARVGRFISSALREHPDHWHMWGRFGEYLSCERREAA